ncbi:hypothetical protein FQA39_LY18064 [Lamprigera yunnana]|nr:hypothetical protein FQA39_LY18064 [Lamprigera yunnana]
MFKCADIFIIFCATFAVTCESLQDKEIEILNNILSSENYDSRIRPQSRNDTLDDSTLVFVNMYVRSILQVDDVNMQYTVQITFRQQWFDERLKYHNIENFPKYLTITKSGLLWAPDLFFSNEIDGHFHDIMTPNLYFRIYPDGSVIYSRRLTLRLGCPMNLKLYPLDRQVCTLRIASYAFTADDLNIMWREYDPVGVVRNLQIQKFTFEKFFTDYCISKTPIGSYGCIKVDFLFKRNFLYYLLQMYVPGYMLVITSWLSFWFDASEANTRMILGVSTLFALMMHTSFIGMSLPSVSYIKSIDVWTGVCLIFVFLALVEFVVVFCVSKSDLRKKILRINSNTSEKDVFLAQLSDDLLGKDNIRMCSKVWICSQWTKRFKTKAKCIDVVSRIFFPILFLLFNFVYWISYTVTESE